MIITCFIGTGSFLNRYSSSRMSVRATCSGIEFRWGRDFPHLSGPALGSTQSPIQWVPGFSQG